MDIPKVPNGGSIDFKIYLTAFIFAHQIPFFFKFMSKKSFRGWQNPNHEQNPDPHFFFFQMKLY